MPKKKNKRPKPSLKTTKGPEPTSKTTSVAEAVIRKTEGAQKAMKTTGGAAKAKKTTGGAAKAKKTTKGAANVAQPTKGADKVGKTTGGAEKASTKKRKGAEPALKKGFKCDFCGRTFSYKKYLENHTCKICSHCGLIYKDKTQFRDHVQKNCPVLKTNADVVNQDNSEDRIRSGPKVCEACHLRFGSVYHLKLHMKTHDGKRQFKCDDCGKSFNHLTSLNEHKKNLHMGKRERLQCPFSNCEKSYFARSHLRRHMKKEHDNKAAGPSDHSDPVGENLTSEWVCKKCLQIFETQDALDAHCCFQCDLCKRDFKNANGLSRHKSFYNGECNLICEICNKKFQRHRQLKEHKKLHTGMAPSCVQCNKTFGTASDLNAHMLGVHKVQEEPFQCTICDKKFTMPKHLTSHMRNYHKNIARKDLPHKCSECVQRFYFKSKLDYHMRTHTGEKPFVCTHGNCNKTFARSDKLRSHVELIHGNNPSKKFKVGKCKYCSKRFFRTKYHLRSHENRCRKRDDCKCVHCKTVFPKRKLYVQHVREICAEREFKFKCYCGTQESFNPEDVKEVLNHVIKCKPSEQRSTFTCYICNHKFPAKIISFHIQDELLHSSLVNQAECTHECSKCKVNFPSKELLNLHTDVEHPCLTNFLKNYKEPLDDITFPVTNKELLIKDREENRKLHLDELKFNEKFPETKCYICFLTFHSKFMKRRHVRFCKKKYGLVDITPLEKPSPLPLSKYHLQKQRGKVIHNKLTTPLAQRIFARLQFDLLKSVLKSWVEKVGSDAYWNAMAREFRVQPYLLKKWLTTFTKAEQEDENSTFSKNREQIMKFMPHAAEEAEPEILILIDWEKETSDNQVVTIDLTGPSENVGNEELTPEEIMKAKSTGVFYRKCITCDWICTSLEEYYRHNHKTASRYFNRKNTSRKNADKPWALKRRRKEWQTEKEKEPGKYDDLTPWMFEDKVPKYPCEICGKPFHGRFMKHAHWRICKKMLEIPHVVEDMDVEDDGMDTEVEDNRMDTEQEDNRIDTEVEDNRMEKLDEVPPAASTGPRLVLVIPD